MWFHIETWHNAQLLKFYRNSLLLFPRAWSKFTRNPRARQLHFFLPLSAPSPAALPAGLWDHGPRTRPASHWGSCCPKSAPCPGTRPRSLSAETCFSLCHEHAGFRRYLKHRRRWGEWRDTRGCSCTRADKVLSAVTSMSGTVVSVELARSLSLQLLWAPTDKSGSRCWYPTRPPPRLLLVVGWIISSWFQRANWRLCVLSKKLYLGSPLRAAVWREKALFEKKKKV